MAVNPIPPMDISGPKSELSEHPLKEKVQRKIEELLDLDIIKKVSGPTTYGGPQGRCCKLKRLLQIYKSCCNFMNVAAIL